MNRFLRLGPVVLVASLAACASTPPVHYHTLLAPSAETAARGAPAPFLIDVLPVGIPEQIDQPQLVVRQGNTGVVVLDGERWAGPLGDELRSALSSELTHRLVTQDIAGLAPPAGQRVLRIKLQVRRFDAWPGQRVQLDADWSLGFTDGAGNARLVCRGRFDQPASGGYPDLVQAQQRTIAALASRIASDARGWASAGQADCAKAASLAGPSPGLMD